MEQARKNANQFMAEHVFRGLLVDEFKFGSRRSGKIGANMVSDYVTFSAQTVPGGFQPLPGGDQLAIHLNCELNAANLANNIIPIRVRQFHITVRTLADQQTIDNHGPSTIIAERSIHMNVNTDWGRPENLAALVANIGIHEDLTLEVRSRQGYNGRYMRTLVEMFKAKVLLTIHQILGVNVGVQWDGDATFP